jgi:hypothetical protein
VVQIWELAYELVTRAESVFSIIWLVIILPRLTSVVPARYRQALSAKLIGVDDDLFD